MTRKTKRARRAAVRGRRGDKRSASARPPVVESEAVEVMEEYDTERVSFGGEP